MVQRTISVQQTCKQTACESKVSKRMTRIIETNHSRIQNLCAKCHLRMHNLHWTTATPADGHLKIQLMIREWQTVSFFTDNEYWYIPVAKGASKVDHKGVVKRCLNTQIQVTFASLLMEGSEFVMSPQTHLMQCQHCWELRDGEGMFFFHTISPRQPEMVDWTLLWTNFIHSYP